MLYYALNGILNAKYNFPTYIVPVFPLASLRRCARAGADVGKEVAEMAMMTKLQRQVYAACRAFVRREMLEVSGTSRGRVKVRRALIVAGHKKSAPIRKF